MPRLMITGASGYLAHRLLPIASGYGEVFGCARHVDDLPATVNPTVLDITDGAAVQAVVEHIRPDAIIHAAASNPGADSSGMEQVNHQGAAHIAKACATTGCRLVGVSTDMVFSGEAAPYADDAMASPLALSEYGRTKALGEKAIISACPDAVVVRTSLIYGLTLMDRGTSGFVERMARGEELNLFSDVQRQPVWVDSLAIALCRLALELNTENGFINIAGSEVLSRADFGLRLLDYWNIKAETAINLVSGRGIDGLPLDLRLSLRRASALGFATPGVEQVLANAGAVN